MFQSAAFIKLLCMVVIGALVLARIVQFFAMGWRWKISQQQIEAGFSKEQKRKEFWILFLSFFALITISIICAFQSVWH